LKQPLATVVYIGFSAESQQKSRVLPKDLDTLLEFDASFRLRELHALFLNEFDRNAHDNAVRLLKQIAKESRPKQMQSALCVPTVDVDVRLGFWRQMYDRAKALKLRDRSIEILEHMQREDAQRGVTV
jgi:hypothetical protein